MTNISSEERLAGQIKRIENDIDAVLSESTAMMSAFVAQRAERGLDPIVAQRPMQRANGLVQSLMEARRKLTGFHADVVKLAALFDVDTSCDCQNSPLAQAKVVHS